MIKSQRYPKFVVRNHESIERFVDLLCNPYSTVAFEASTYHTKLHLKLPRFGGVRDGRTGNFSRVCSRPPPYRVYGRIHVLTPKGVYLQRRLAGVGSCLSQMHRWSCWRANMEPQETYCITGSHHVPSSCDALKFS